MYLTTVLRMHRPHICNICQKMFARINTHLSARVNKGVASSGHGLKIGSVEYKEEVEKSCELSDDYFEKVPSMRRKIKESKQNRSSTQVAGDVDFLMPEVLKGAKTPRHYKH